MARAYDIVGFGVVAVDDIVVVDHQPVPDMKHRMQTMQRFGGGLTATAMVAAARLGCECWWGGRFGDNALAEYSYGVFAREGIDFVRDPGRHPEAAPFHSIITCNTEDGSRMAFFNDSAFPNFKPAEDDLKVVESARCLFVDQYAPVPQLAAAKRAREHGVPVVADIEDLGNAAARELAEMADHLIVPLAVMCGYFNESDPAEAVRRGFGLGRKELVCVTDGMNGSWFATGAGAEVRHQQAFRVDKVVDTNGCGDVFHGVYAAFLVKGAPAAERIRRAAAAAAMKARTAGGQPGTPTMPELDVFLREYS